MIRKIEGWKSATTVINSTRRGNEISMSTKRIRMVSTAPPKKPLTAPTNVPKVIEMLTAILMPSKTINEKYRTWVIQMDDGRALTGIVTQQDAQAIYLVQNPLANADPIRIPRDQIEAMQQSDVSTMPMGQLNTLTRDEILDLLAYIRSGGNS